ncbi:MAG: D-alanyl-D-alanine carboxypeptidase, partial [Clostridia bacterium]|nr:D-alanyl-D-alanine carboxypeptidase [Clostridia bacterium]
DAVYDDINGAGVVLSARDLAKLGKALSKSETFRNYSNLFYDSITHDDGRETELANPNKLLRYLSGCIGIATGSSNEAGYCGVFAVSRNDTVYICVTLGSKNSSERFDLATEMTEYAFASYKTMKTAAKGQIIEEQISVSGGIKKSVDLVAKNDCMLIFRNGSSYEAYAEIPEQLEAPLSTEQTVGKIEYKDSDGNLIGTLELCPSENIEQASFWDNVLSVFRNYLHA